MTKEEIREKIKEFNSEIGREAFFEKRIYYTIDSKNISDLIMIFERSQNWHINIFFPNERGNLYEIDGNFDFEDFNLGIVSILKILIENYNNAITHNQYADVDSCLKNISKLESLLKEIEQYKLKRFLEL